MGGIVVAPVEDSNRIAALIRKGSKEADEADFILDLITYKFRALRQDQGSRNYPQFGPRRHDCSTTASRFIDHLSLVLRFGSGRGLSNQHNVCSG